MKKIAVSLIAICLLLPIFFGLITSEANAATTQSANKVFLGLSGYPTSTTQIDNIIATMKANGLNTYRMSANPTWSSGPHPYHKEFIQYFLDHSDFTIIVDRNHLYPPTEASATSARNNWASARNSVFEVLQAYPNNPRVIVELVNEYISSDFYSRMQSLVTEIRSAGYTNGILF
ncbi:glycoside hydrolase family 5 protein, partial [Candidatus Bathyarchaeota archaeon]|nr:glycoside hydrolase family 5 protein [Candidatus Bathyarchaeota archaeon]